MPKPFTPTNSLLKLMRSRNISIKKGTEGSKVKNILSRENYYSIINGYKDIFLDKAITEQTKEDYYITGTTFFQIYSVYCFDRNLRNILMKSLLQAEKNLGTKVAYYFSKAHKSEFSHLNINNFSKSDLPNATGLISKLSSVTQKNSKSKDSGFYHYLTKHQDLPLWVLVTKLTFGEITNFYKVLTPSLQEEILENINKEYTNEFNIQITSPTSLLIKDFNTILNILVPYRNICAHGDRLYNHREKHGRNIIKPNYYFTNKNPISSESSFYGLLICLRLFLTRIDYKHLIKDVINELKSLEKQLPTPQFNLLLSKMEFTLNWEKTLEALK